MASWTLRSLFGMGGEKKPVHGRQTRRQRDRQWKKRRAARDQFLPESLEQRAMMAVVLPAYEITQDWGSGFEAGIELQNLDTETFNDWVVSFDYAADITSIWDAAIVARDGDRYTIEHAGWNATLEAGRSVAFGFIGSGSSAAPTNFLINGEPLEGQPADLPTDPVISDPVAPEPEAPATPTDDAPTDPVASDPVAVGELSASLSVVSDWGSGFTGDVTVRNDSSSALEGWNVSFDFAGEISSLWNGEIVSRSGSTYTVRGVSWNEGIAAGGSVSFGFSGTPGGEAAVLENIIVSGVNNGPVPIEPTPAPEPLPAPTPEPAPEPAPEPDDGSAQVFAVNPAGADITGFDPAVDRLDFGEISVHNLIVGKTEAGEVAIINPWAWTPEYQVLTGIGFEDLTLENYGVVGNEHLRQDLGGVISWELGVGPREAGTVYVRSHEYGVQERVENFDPAVNKLSFLYFGTRERLSVADTAEGVLISVEPTGQSVLLAGVAKADLVPANIEFHHDQIVEDQLEVPFGYTVEQVTMVSRSALLTPLAPEGAITDGHQTSPGSVNPHDGHDHDHGDMPMTGDPVVTDPVVTDPVVNDPVVTDPEPTDPVMPPMDGHDMTPPASTGEYIDITTWGMFHDSNDNSHSDELVGGRTAITTEAMVAYNNLRAFIGLSALTVEDVGAWAFAEQLTNNAEAYGDDLKGVGLYYAMQGAKVGWIAQEVYDPQILADIQRTARLGEQADVMAMVRQYGIDGYADFLEENGFVDAFVNTLKMEPHYGGWMHGRTHGYRSIEGVAINHDVNHLTVLSWDQTQPFMNDTFDWPQWPALDVSDSGVIEYYQSMVVLGDPVGLNMEFVAGPAESPVSPTDPVVTDPVIDPVVTDPVVTDPVVTDPVTEEPTAPVAPADPSALPIASHDKVLAAYFPEWGIYGRDYHLADVPADQLTHLIYAFADLTAEGEMTLFDSYAATEKRFSAEDSVTGEADLWYYPPEDPRSEQTVWGNFNQLALLKEQYPHLTVSIAVGGWTLSDHFSSVTSTQAGRDTFSDSIVEFLTTYQVFDGIDFDWEYPGGGGEAGNSVSPDDGANYALLLADVRAKLDDLGSQLGKTYEISVASPAGLDKIANFNLAGLAPSVDFFNVMTYDFHGTWEDTTGHQAAFTGDPNGYDIETAVYAYLDAGVAPEQIVLGAPLYTRAWSGVADGGDGGYDEAASGAAPGTFEAGNYDYKDLLSQINAGAGWELYWDDNAQASYLYNADLDIFSSFETTTSIALKAEWADAMGLGGMMFWDLSNDATGSPDSLISAAFRSMVLEEDVADIQADSSLSDPIVVGGDGEIGPLPL